jgi:type IV pilus assembly protein PilQ
MIARRLVTSLVLAAALIGNVSVLAGTSASLGSAAEGQAFTLVSLRHETVGATTRIQVESSAPPLYTVFRPSDRLIIVDLPGCEGSQLAPEYAVKTAMVDSIAVKQSDAAGAARRAMRLEVAVRADSRDRSTVSGNTLTLEIAPDTETPGQLSREDAKHAGQKSENTSTGVYVYPAPLTSKRAANATKAPVHPVSQPTGDNTAAKPAALRPATVIRDVHAETNGGGVRIVVEADGALQYKDFILSDPWRVVVDIAGVRSAFGNRVTPVGASSVDRLRVGQPGGNVVRLVLDAKSKLNYHVVREGQQLIITVGNPGASVENSYKPVERNSTSPADRSTKTPEKPVVATASKAEVKVAGERIENKSDKGENSNLIAQSKSSQGSRPPQVGPAPNRSLPLNTQPAPAQRPAVSGPASQPAATNRSAMDVQRQPAAPAGQDSRSKGVMPFCEPNYVGGLISFDLRAGVDIRDMLRFISQQYGVNFIVDKSVSSVPVDIRVTDVPWNQVMDSVLRANRLGTVCESNGKMIRIATLGAIKEEQDAQRAIAEANDKLKPLITKIIHLKYARAAGSLSAAGSGKSASGGSGGLGMAAGGAAGQGSLMSIVNTRLSPRGRVEIDGRTNSLIITDLPEYTQVIEEMIARLDRPEPQVEIEARIVIASRNFLRDIGVELASGVTGRNGRAGVFETSPATFNGGGLSNSQNGGSASSGGTGSGTGSGSGGSASTKQLGPNLLGPFANGSLTAAANSVLSLTTGVLGTSIISAALSAQETKGQIRTIASPRVTTTDNKTAEIVNGVQIPVQTVSNNTITTTFVTAALRLEITPQIIEESGQVLMHVVAENNTVNFSLANQFNNGTPGIDTQSAESTVLVSDGGTTVMGGINTDTESHTINRTPGLAKIPLVGELFKRRTVRRDAGEILFFLTPRIIKYDGLGGPGSTQRSSNEGIVNPVAPQRAAAPPVAGSVPTSAKAEPEQAPAASKKGGGQK